MNNEESSPQSLAPTLAHIPLGIVSLADHEAHAQTVLDAKTWAYLSGGAAGMP
jgi:4-hydroxymandelate oxidase